MKTLRWMMMLALFSSLLLRGLVSAAGEGEYTPIPKTEDTHPAYIAGIYTKNDITYIEADYIQWYEGIEADRVFREKYPDSGLDGAPDGYFILNDNPKLLTLEVSQDAEVRMQIYRRSDESKSMDIQWNEPLSLDKFKSIFASQELLHDYPYHLTVKDGKVVSIVQQYIP